MQFTLLATSGRARRGRLELAHGAVETPVFMPVGTYGTVKAMAPNELARARRADRARQHLPPLAPARGRGRSPRTAGCTGSWAGSGPILTDSGGFQVWSLGRAAQGARGGRRRSRRPSTATGCCSRPRSRCRCSARSAPTSPWCSTSARRTRRRATRRRRRWSCRCAGRGARAASSTALGGPNALFGIVQGGMFADLRDASLRGDRWPRLRRLRDRRAVGRRAEGRRCSRCSSTTAPRLPADRPRYLMGVGTPEDIVAGVARGIDMFDCVLPTRNARNG